MNKQYYIACDKKGVIWGVGTTPLKASQDAEKSIKQHIKWETQSGNQSISAAEFKLADPIRCSRSLYKDVRSNGWCEQTWHIINGVAQDIEEALDGLLDKPYGEKVEITVKRVE